eukprot:998078_1
MMWILALILSTAQSADPNWVYESKAMFHRYAMGSVTVINGNVMIDLDITNISWYQGVSGTGVPENCFDNGAYVYIHEEWNNDEDEWDYMGRNNCNDDQTGDHFDPWYACSTASGGDDCNTNGGCIRPSSFISWQAGVLYRCSDSIYSEYPYACEMGDMSKHERMLSTSGNKINEKYKSLWELNGLDFGEDFSIVFHCSDDAKTPVLCAKFNTTNRTMNNKDPIHIKDSNNKIGVNFNGLRVNDESYNGIIIEQGQGWIRYKLPSSMSYNCSNGTHSMWSVYIMNEWNTTMMNGNTNNARYNEWCNWTYVGGVYDPTYSCINQDNGGMESGNIHCQDGTRCPNDGATAVDYECDNWENALKCAAGHMTGKTGYIIMEKGESYDMTFNDRTSPPLNDLVGKSILLKCETENAYPMTICTPIKSSSLSLSSTEDEITGVTAGGAIAIVLLILLAIGIGSAYFYGKKHPTPENNNGNNSKDNKFAVLNGNGSPRTNDISVNNISDASEPKPLATGDPIYSPPETNNNNNKESIALPDDTNNDIPIGTMNEGDGGYIGNQDEQQANIDIDNNNEEYNDEEYEYIEERDVNNKV